MNIERGKTKHSLDSFRKVSKLLTALTLTVILGIAFMTSVQVFADMPPLVTITFPAGTYVIPMDEKQAALTSVDTTVYGFCWRILKDGADLYRIIEPPDVTLYTTLNPGGAVYSGGVILVMAADASIIMAALVDFPTVTTGTLTASFTSNRVFTISQATRILVIRGIYGMTWMDLDAMRVPYTIVDKGAVEANPDMLLNYDLVVDDCPGWGVVVLEAPPVTHPEASPVSLMPDAVRDSFRHFVSMGGEAIFTDIAFEDLNVCFPGYVSIVVNVDGVWSCDIHNPPITGFSAEYPSQYPTTFPTTIEIYTMGGGRIVDTLLRPTEVRVWMDSHVYADYLYRVLGFYFQYDKGIVEGMAYHPQEQTYAYTGDPYSFVAGTIFYGNKFVFTPPKTPTPTPPVGGYIIPVSKLELVAPWAGIGLIIAAIVIVTVVFKRREA